MTHDFDFSSFNPDDVAKIGLQRTRHLMSLPRLGSPTYTAWCRGIDLPLRLEARLRREKILQGAMRDISAEFDRIATWIGERPITKIMDIGCGHALIDLLFWRRYKCNIHLVDIEKSDSNHHEYHDSGSGYASLDAAKRFLVSNGVAEERIKLSNPHCEPLLDCDLDLILSTFSAGFHYPISTYTDFALTALKPGGVLIFDSRNDTGQEAMLAEFDKIEVLETGLKHRKIAAARPKG